MSSSDGILLHRLPTSISSIMVSNGTSIPVTSRGHSVLSTASSNFALNNVLVDPSIVRNLLSVRQFTRDNSCSSEFDTFGFSVKDLWTGCVILRRNSDGDLYTISSVVPIAASSLLAVSSSLWHQCLGHPGPTTLDVFHKNRSITCNKITSCLCHSWQLGKHVRLLFVSSTSHSIAPFQLVHCDVWTSPVASNSGFLYYLVPLDDYTHYCWRFPLKRKSDVHQLMTSSLMLTPSSVFL